MFKRYEKTFQLMYNKIQQIKKIELHRHIEGCISVDYFHNLIKRHHPGSKYHDIELIRELFSYNTFKGFLDAFETVVSHVRTIEDLSEMAKVVRTQLENENIVYAELLFSPQPFLRNGMELNDILNALKHVFDGSSVKTTLIIDIVRNFGVEEAEKFMKKMVGIPEGLKSWVRAISIGGDELNYPPELFKEVFVTAMKHGFRTYAHAGEWASHNSIKNAIDLLKINRVGHGIRVIDDDELITYIKKNKITLDISPTSNYFTGALKEDEEHPIKSLIEKGVKVTINTDDPGFFFTDLNKEYEKVLDMGVEFSYLENIGVNNLDNTFLTDSEKEEIEKLLN